MEATLRPKKRKQPSPSDPFVGIFTRSKSQIYLHCNRSGQARSDCILRPNHFTDSEKPRRKLRSFNQQETSQIDDDMSHIAIKDLRSRRVFSPASLIDDCCEKPFEKQVVGKFDYTNPNDTKLSDSMGEVEKFDLAFSGMDQNLNDQNPNLHSTVNREDGKVMEIGGIDELEKGFTCKSEDLDVASIKLPRTERGIESCNVKQRIDEEGTELCAQTASAVNENGGVRGENGEISNGSVARNKRKINRRNDAISKSKLVSPSGEMVFKTPSSFSYKRLLPVLMDIAKENSCGSKNVKSLSSNSKDKYPNLSSKVDDCISGKEEDLGRYCDDGKTEDSGKIKKFCRESPCKVRDSNVTSPNIIQTKGNVILHKVEQRSWEDGENSNGVELIEERIEMTPPDADIFCKPEVNDNLEDTEENYLQTEDGNLAKPANERVSINGFCVDQSLHADVYRRNYSTLKSQLVLNPCSRLKVFKTPASFSYRRLLPFLMDVTKEDSCTSKGSQCPKVDIVEEKPHLCQETPIDACKTDSFSMGNQTCDKGPNLSPTILAPTVGSSNNELNLLLAKRTTEMQNPDFQKERILQVEQVKSDAPEKLEPNHDKVDFSKDAMPIEAVRLDQNSSRAFVPSGGLVNCPPRGILKRNPRGCRGLCNCLNCASFRLHADRAFEFSRNQMQDTEEVVLELIKELSYLRNILEKSDVDGNDHVVHVNQSKEACIKALKAEQLAKGRLSEMNSDLTIHCRSMCLQRPKVRFADSTEEIVIPKVDFQTR
ncbi:uncharacterized protein LOC132274772 isoform X2 [Cornus florida]|uniref:uncharacterized protein LOC132274772 isoform X2 n=1 Tax=Cornus florida TaxID=4283 RepID=UPI002898D01B|nr:uncharacterized protein LOC132274772 isoform X2 [Cornus florida]